MEEEKGKGEKGDKGDKGDVVKKSSKRGLFGRQKSEKLQKQLNRSTESSVTGKRNSFQSSPPSRVRDGEESRSLQVLKFSDGDEVDQGGGGKSSKGLRVKMNNNNSQPLVGGHVGKEKEKEKEKKAPKSPVMFKGREIKKKD